MAGLKKKRNYWYAVINKWDGVKNKEEYIRLSKNKTEARVRLAKVEKVEKDIKNGMDFSFAWLNEECKTIVKILTIKEVANKYLDTRKNTIRDSTLNRDKITFNNFFNYIDENLPIKYLDRNLISKYSSSLIKDNYKPAGININLTHLKTFINWSYENKYINKPFKINKVKIGSPLPRYLDENQLNSIYKLDSLSEYFKNAFYFYESTGCRTREPFVGELCGNWLIVDIEDSKTKIVRQIQLTNELKDILTSMHQLRDSYFNQGYKLDSLINRHTKVFKKSLRKIGVIDDNISLKSLRHTFAVKRYLITRDIYQVKNELGHTKVSTTEIYANFKFERLKDDFPSIIKESILPTNNIKRSDISVYRGGFA